MYRLVAGVLQASERMERILTHRGGDMVPVLTILVYGLFLLAILVGGKVAGKGQFFADGTGREATGPLRGIAAIGVVLHHISQNEHFQSAGEIRLFLNAGFLFVAIFMFLSGYGLIKSLDSKPDYMDGFLKRRLPVIVVPYYVSVLFFLIFALVSRTHYEPAEWVTNLLGLTMMNKYAWFPIVLTILYVCFYLVFRGEKSRNASLVKMLFAVLGLVLLYAAVRYMDWWLKFHYPGTWWNEPMVRWFAGEWWVNSSIGFWVGIFVASKEEAIRAFFRKGYLLKLFVSLLLVFLLSGLSFRLKILLGYWNETIVQGPGIGTTFLCVLAQFPHVTFFVFSIYLLLLKVKTSNPVTRFMGRISLESYMMNYPAILITSDHLLKAADPETAKFRALYMVLVILLTLLLALVYRAVNQGLLRRLSGR